MTTGELDILGKSLNLRVAYLDAESLRLAASLLYTAYQDDPLFMSIFDASKRDYDQRLRAAIREELHAFWDSEDPIIGLFGDDQLLAVACVVAPGSPNENGRYWHWRLKMLSSAGIVSTQQMLEKEKRIRAAIPAQHYHFLAFIAVHPQYQQQGLGAYILKCVDTIVEENIANEDLAESASEHMSEGIGALVTMDKYRSLFSHQAFNSLGTLPVGDIEGELFFRTRNV